MSFNATKPQIMPVSNDTFHDYQVICSNQDGISSNKRRKLNKPLIECDENAWFLPKEFLACEVNQELLSQEFLVCQENQTLQLPECVIVLEPEPEITGISKIMTSVGSRDSNEDTHIDETVFNVNGVVYSFYAIFDGHGGKQVSQLCQDKMLEYLKLELETLDLMDEVELEHLSISRAFNNATDRLDRDIKSKNFKGGSTGLMILETWNRIYIHQMGDCRASIGNIENGELIETNVSMVDGELSPTKIINLGYQEAQTPIHCMPGLAVFRDNVDRSQPMVCTEESMKRMYIKNDDKYESAWKEWCAYNIAYCHNIGSNPCIKNPIMPRKDRNSPGYRLCLCGTQPTRGFSGNNEKTLKHGQTFRFDLSQIDRKGCLIVYGCDGVEDNGAIPVEKIIKVSTSLDKMMELLDDNNRVIKAHPKKTNYPHQKTFLDKMKWFETESHYLPVDTTWKNSIKNSSIHLQSYFKNIELLEEAFKGNSETDLELTIKTLIEFCNVRASADNVSIGIKKW